jgi:hypothetical protein
MDERLFPGKELNMPQNKIDSPALNGHAVSNHELEQAVQRAVQTAIPNLLADPKLTDAVRHGTLAALQTTEFHDQLFRFIVNVIYNPDLRGSDVHGIGSRVDKGTQILLMLKYRELMRAGGPLPSFEDVGFRVFSQFDEDGILLYIFSLIGMTTRTSVEICAGVGYECNTANLIVNHGYHGLLFDGNPQNIEKARLFYLTRPDTAITPPVLAHAWIEADTIDGMISGNGFTGEVDLLSLDMDGIDYWVWKAIQCIQPRVVVVEYHACWGPDEAKTVPNVKGFQIPPNNGAYCGASLAAFNKLANERGYRLVGCNRNRLNAFFVRNGLADDLLPEVSVASCLDYHRIRSHWDPVRAAIKNCDWVTV